MERHPEDEPLRRQWLVSAEEEEAAELGAAALLCLEGKSGKAQLFSVHIHLENGSYH